MDILRVAEQAFVVGDSSKVGIVLEHRFAAFEDDVLLVCDEDVSNEKLQQISKRYPDKLLLV
jgi:DeoR/GlpR family transcriptional regulator of sugar metabolism